MFNTKHLRTFLSVVEFGSIVGGARALRRAQSAVTRSIRELEKGLHADLFERRPHGMILTEMGQSFLARAQRALATMKAAEQALSDELPDGSWARNAPIFSLSVNEQRLRILVLLAEQHSMGAVASRLAVSQPAVSQAIREIETGLQSKLFRRTQRGMMPTPAGRLIALHVKLALAELRVAEEEVLSLRGLTMGSVAIGALSLGRTLLLPRAITTLLTRFPGLNVRTVEGSFEHLATQLREGGIDFILGALRPAQQTAGFVRETVSQDRMVLLVRTGHPILGGAAISLPFVAGLRWVLPPPGTPTRELLTGSLRACGLSQPIVQVETADPAVTLGTLLGSDMVSAASFQTFHREIASGDLTVLPVNLPDTQRPIGILLRAGGAPSEATRLLIEILRDLGRGDPDDEAVIASVL